jgi:glycosyltransferase involved in cell wall biosynthesis
MVAEHNLLPSVSIVIPKISLIMTVYNRDRYLAAAIQSVLQQTFSNFELLLWDDGSSDRSPEIAQAFAQQDPRIRFISADHHGRVRALQAAHALAQGEYLGWIDSDDLLTPVTLAATLALLKNSPQSGWVYTNHQVIDANGHCTGNGRRCQIPYSPERLLIDFMTFHFRLIRRSVFEQAGGINPHLPAAIDYDLCLRLSEIAAVQHLQIPLYFYRTHPHSISGLQYQQQIECSQTAIAQALQRQGLSDRYRIEVQAGNRFVLKKK